MERLSSVQAADLTSKFKSDMTYGYPGEKSSFHSAVFELGQRGCCCFCATCPNRKMYLEITGADEGLSRFKDAIYKLYYKTFTNIL